MSLEPLTLSGRCSSGSGLTCVSPRGLRRSLETAKTPLTTGCSGEVTEGGLQRAGLATPACRGPRVPLEAFDDSRGPGAARSADPGGGGGCITVSSGSQGTLSAGWLGISDACSTSGRGAQEGDSSPRLPGRSPLSRHRWPSGGPGRGLRGHRTATAGPSGPPDLSRPHGAAQPPAFSGKASASGMALSRVSLLLPPATSICLFAARTLKRTVSSELQK